jgi:hypothetical protein
VRRLRLARLSILLALLSLVLGTIVTVTSRSIAKAEDLLVFVHLDNATDVTWWTANIDGSYSVFGDYPGACGTEGTDFWRSPNGVDEWTLFWDTGPDITYGTWCLEPNTEYYLKLRWYYEYGYGICSGYDVEFWSDAIHFTTPSDPGESYHGPIHTTVNLVYTTSTTATFEVTGALEESSDTRLRIGGVVYGTTSMPYPSGLQENWTEVLPWASGYDAYEMDYQVFAPGIGGTRTVVITDLLPDTTYYYRGFVDEHYVGDYVYSLEGFFGSDPEPPEPAVPSPLTRLVATPIAGNEISVSWYDPNDHAALPSIKTLLRYKAWEYPTEPTGTDDSTLAYYADVEQGSHAISVMGLEPGTTYYFTLWRYDTDLDEDAYTEDDTDFATTPAGITPIDPVDTPDNWFTDPTCDAWANIPMAMSIINGIEDKMGMPTDTLCLMINLFLVSCAMTTSYGGMTVTTRRPTGTQTILVPFAVMCAAFIIGPIIGAFPGFFLAIGVIIGLGVAFAWARA